MLLYSFTPFLTEGQDILAEICLGGSILLLQLGTILYIQYWHNISREVFLVSKLFYLISGAGIVIVVLNYNPWKIYYLRDLGYHQDLSLQFSIILVLVLFCGTLIMYVILERVKQSLSQELQLMKVKGLEIQRTGHQYNPQLLDQQTRFLNSRKRLSVNMRTLTMIKLFWILGGFLVCLGIVLPGTSSFNADSIGVLLFFLPQAYYATKDKWLLTLLLVQRVKVRARKFHESFTKLETQFPQEIVYENLETLVKFIEKADALLYFQESLAE